MATKKEKRRRALEKRQEFMEEVRQNGLKAQRMDRERRHKKALRDWQEPHDKDHSWKRRVAECPHCAEEIKRARQIANAAPLSEAAG